MTRTIGELRRREKSRRYSAAMSERWKHTRALARATRSLTPQQQAALDEAFCTGFLIQSRPGSAALENRFYRESQQLDRPYAVVHAGAKTADLTVDYITTRRHITDEGAEEARRLIEGVWRGARRRMEWSAGSLCVGASGIPVGVAPELVRALLDLPTWEVVP